MVDNQSGKSGSGKLRIIIGAVISLTPYSAGMAWNWMQLAVGLRKLGHDVYYLEEVEPDWCVDAQGRPCDLEHSVNCELFRATMVRFGLGGRACQIYNRGEATFGLSLDSLLALARDADLLINIAGHVKTDCILDSVWRRAYMDQDPVYTQLWHAEYGKDLNFGRHDVFLTVGLNMGTPHTSIPDCGLTWHPVLPPVVLEFWPLRIDPSCSRFTSVASWKSFRGICYQGEWYRTKYEEFRRFAGLPRIIQQEFEIAMRRYRNDDEGIRLLRENGWSVIKASHISSLSGYQDYIARSRAEIGIAKNAYVKGRSGWFSDRSAHYLASGKPVLAQATGFELHLPTGRGLLAFSTLQEAAVGVEAINGDYLGHCCAAREFAAEYLEYTKVLPRMLDVCLA